MEGESQSASTFSNRIRTRLISGLLVFIPLGITLFVVKFLLGTAAGLLLPLTGLALDEWPRFWQVAISLAAFLVIVYLVGEIATHVVGRRLIAIGESLLVRVPLVKPVYTASKQVIETFASPRAAEIKSVVFIEFPRPGMRTIGFVTGTIDVGDRQNWYKVFIPTTPNPTTGFFEIVPPHGILQTDLPVEDAIKLVMSGGVIAPRRIQMTAGTEPSAA